MGLVGPVSVHCDWVRRKVGSAASISVWYHVKLSVQIRPWDTLACCWDVKQPTNKLFYTISASEYRYVRITIIAKPLQDRGLSLDIVFPVGSKELTHCGLFTSWPLTKSQVPMAVWCSCWLVGCLTSQQHASCISRTDLLRQFDVLPHWDRSCRSNVPSHPVTVYWHRADQSQRWPYNARRLAG